jgi:hypothetical protein
MDGSWRVTGPVTEGGGRPQATRLALAPGDVFPRALDFSLGRPSRLDEPDFSSVPFCSIGPSIRKASKGGLRWTAVSGPSPRSTTSGASGRRMGPRTEAV